MSRFSEVPIQHVEQYWDQRPCNLRHSPSPVGSRRYFEEVEARKYYVEPHILDFAKFDRWYGNRVLEVGCGIGSDSINFARAGAWVTAVDISKESLRIARERAGIYELNHRIHFMQANAETLASTLGFNNGYDLIYSFGVLHHTPDPELALRNLRQLLYPTGMLKIMLYHRRSTKALGIVKGRFWKADELIARQSEAETNCPVTYSYTRKEARELLEDTGFHVDRVDIRHIFPYQVKAYRNFEYKKRWYWRMTPQSWFDRLEKSFGWHLCITARTNAH